MSPLFAPFEFSLTKTSAVVIAVGLVASYDLFQRYHHRETHLVFSVMLGTVLSLALMKVVQVLFEPGVRQNAHVMALGILLVLLLWRALFGPWRAQTKAGVLGTFLFWIGLLTFVRELPEHTTVRLLATITAVIPAVVWCALFLEYHRERMCRVFLMFFTGMVSTIPILFYDALVRRGIEFQFFVLRVTPESFNRSAEQFVSGQLVGISPMHSTMLSVLLSFLIVGVIEELSKYWALRHSGDRFFSSIDDVIQLSIIVAIGFSFAENISNPGYFMGFVREYLVDPDVPDYIGFLSNVVGRSVMTSMVHIVATGVMGYFLGCAIFAEPLLEDDRKKGRVHEVLEWCSSILRIRQLAIFRTQMILIGIVSAIVLHGLFNFLVTVPDLLPGNPRTLGDMFGAGEGSPLHYIALLLLPALFYVVGGFWLLTGLFLKKENIEERGYVVRTEVFIREA